MVREAAVPAAAPDRPVLAPVTGDSVRFEWPGLERRELSAPAPWIAR